MKITKLNAEDSKLRFDIVSAALKVIESEKISVPVYADGEIVDFAYEWQGLTGKDTRNAKRLLSNREAIEGESVLEWIFGSYSIDRLKALYDFSAYCDWLNAKEVIRHFGADLLKPFMALQGKTPPWSVGIPYHSVLQVAFVELYRRYRVYTIRQWLREHWDEATKLFEENAGTMESFPYVQGVEYRHVHTQYRRMEREKVRAWMRKEAAEGG